MPVSIINKPDVVFANDKVTSRSTKGTLRISIKGSLFGYSLATQDEMKNSNFFDEKENILIGAPKYSSTGALFKCDVYGKCNPFYSDGRFQNNSMYGSTIEWISEKLFISCEPRYTEYFDCVPYLKNVKNCKIISGDKTPG